MPRVYKWLAVGLAAVVLFVGGVALFLYVFLTSERITAWVKPRLEQHLHRKVTLAEARWGMRGLQLEGVEVRKEGANSALLTCDRLELRWNPAALLALKIAIRSLVLEKPVITLIRHEDGSLNIDDLLKPPAAEKSGANQPSAGGGDSDAISLLIALVSMNEGRLNLVDRFRGPVRTLALTGIHSRVSELTSTGPIPFRLNGRIEDESPFAADGTIDPAANILQADLEVADLDLIALSRHFRETAGAIRQGKLSLTGSLKIAAGSRLKTHGTLNLKELQLEVQHLPTRPMAVKADFEVNLNRDQQVLEIPSLHLVLDGQEAQITATLRRWRQQPRLQFTMNSPTLKLDKLLALLPGTSAPPEKEPEHPPLSPPSEKGSASLLGGIRPGSLLALLPGVDSSEASEKAPEIEGQVESPPQDEAGQQEPIGKPETPQANAQEQEAAGDPSSYTAPLQTALQAEGEVHLDWLYYQKLVASNVDCGVLFRTGKLWLKPVTADLYGGKVQGALQAAVEEPAPPFHLSLSLEDVLLNELVRALWPDTVYRWAGNLSLTSKAEGVGTALAKLRSRTEMVISEAEFSGTPLMKKLSQLLEAEDLERLYFSEVTGQVVTSKGTATLEQLRLDGPIVAATGSGTAGLLDRKLDLRLLLRFPAQYAGKLAMIRTFLPDVVDEEGFVRMPVTVSGTLDEPQIRPDPVWLERHLKKGAEDLQNQPLPKLPLEEERKKKIRETIEQLLQ